MENLKRLIAEYKAVRDMRNMASRDNELMQVEAHNATLESIQKDLNKFDAAEVMAAMKG